MVKVNVYMMMVEYMRVNMKLIRCMDKEYLHGKMVESIMDCGVKANNMVEEK